MRNKRRTVDACVCSADKGWVSCKPCLVPMKVGKRDFITHFPVFILYPTHIIGISEEFVHISSCQHNYVLMRVDAVFESSESQGQHGELVVMAPNMVCTKTKLCRPSKNTQQQSAACFLPFSNSAFNRAERPILFPSFQELGNLAIGPNHVPHFLFLQETFSL